MAVSIERGGPSCQEITLRSENIVIEALRELADWLCRQLEQEYEYRSSDEVVDETILANA